MIKNFFRKSPVIFIVILILIFLIPGLSFLLLHSNSNNPPQVHDSVASFFLPHASLLRTGAYYRVAGQDPTLFPENNLLLLRCLFPSEELLNCWRYDDLTKNVTGPLIGPASLASLSLPQVKNFQQEMSYQGEQELDQAFSGQPKTSSGMVQDISVLSDLDLRGPFKPTGKLMINTRYPNYCFPVSWP